MAEAPRATSLTLPRNAVSVTPTIFCASRLIMIGQAIPQIFFSEGISVFKTKEDWIQFAKVMNKHRIITKSLFNGEIVPIESNLESFAELPELFKRKLNGFNIFNVWWNFDDMFTLVINNS